MKHEIDILIIGGGIAGLWTLARLRKLGYTAYLLENNRIGGIQSIASQGIIHGGTKYALGGKLGDSAKAIGNMPAIWQDCLNGKGEIDLSAVEVHTDTQLMWSTKSAVSRVAGFFAGKLMQDRMQQLDKNSLPAPFDHAGFDGIVYRLNEPVLNTESLINALYSQLNTYCIRGTADFDRFSLGDVVCMNDSGERFLQLKPKKVVLTAGFGNRKLLQALKQKEPVMQTRPVHMTMVKARKLPSLYAHCLGASSSPRVTITSTQHNGFHYWYVGGGISETGVSRNRDEQIKACRQELQDVLPWVDLNQAQWSTLMLDRAEVQTPGNKRPESSSVSHNNDVITVWPTKLAFAPKAAAEVLQILQQNNIDPSMQEITPQDYPSPPVARWPWLDAQWSD